MQTRGFNRFGISLITCPLLKRNHNWCYMCWGPRSKKKKSNKLMKTRKSREEKGWDAGCQRCGTANRDCSWRIVGLAGCSSSLHVPWSCAEAGFSRPVGAKTAPAKPGAIIFSWKQEEKCMDSTHVCSMCMHAGTQICPPHSQAQSHTHFYTHAHTSDRPYTHVPVITMTMSTQLFPNSHPKS